MHVPRLMHDRSAPARREGSQSPLSGTSPASERVLAMTRSPSVPGGDSVVHLIIRKPYNLGWRHRPGDGRVELSISAEATAGAVAAELEVRPPVRTPLHRRFFDAKAAIIRACSILSYPLCALLLAAVLLRSIACSPTMHEACDARGL